MKKFILIALCFLALLKAQSQTVDTTIKRCIAAPIEAKLYTHGFPAVTDTLKFIGVFEFKNSYDSVVSVSYTFITPDKSRNIEPNWLNLTKTEAANWDNTLFGLLPILAARFGLVFE